MLHVHETFHSIGSFLIRPQQAHQPDADRTLKYVKSYSLCWQQFKVEPAPQDSLYYNHGTHNFCAELSLDGVTYKGYGEITHIAITGLINVKCSWSPLDQLIASVLSVICVVCNFLI